MIVVNGGRVSSIFDIKAVKMWEFRCANIKEQIRCLLLCCHFEWFANRMNRLKWGRCGCKWERQRWWLWAVSSIFITNMINCPFDEALTYLWCQCSLDGLFKYSTPLLCMVCYQKKKKKPLFQPHQSTTGNVAETRCERINSSADPCHNPHNV